MVSGPRSHSSIEIRGWLLVGELLDPTTQPLPELVGRSRLQMFFLPWVFGVKMSKSTACLLAEEL